VEKVLDGYLGMKPMNDEKTELAQTQCQDQNRFAGVFGGFRWHGMSTQTASIRSV
jgi:hypothetical protein